MRNGLNREAKRPKSERETGRFGRQKRPFRKALGIKGLAGERWMVGWWWAIGDGSWVNVGCRDTINRATTPWMGVWQDMECCGWNSNIAQANRQSDAECHAKQALKRSKTRNSASLSHQPSTTNQKATNHQPESHQPSTRSPSTINQKAINHQPENHQLSPSFTTFTQSTSIVPGRSASLISPGHVGLPRSSPPSEKLRMMS